MSVLSKLNYRFSKIPIKITGGSFEKSINILLCFLVRHVKYFEVVIPVLTKKELNQLKINNSSLIHQRIEVTGKTAAPKPRKTDRQRITAYWEQKPKSRN